MLETSRPREEARGGKIDPRGLAVNTWTDEQFVETAEGERIQLERQSRVTSHVTDRRCAKQW